MMVSLSAGGGEATGDRNMIGFILASRARLRKIP